MINVYLCATKLFKVKNLSNLIKKNNSKILTAAKGTKKNMGMIGNYIAVNSDTLKEIEEGSFDFFDADPDKYPALDIDKAWQVIHYMLCDGDIAEGEPPMGYVAPIREENAIDLEDLDYGAFLITNEQVKKAYDYIKNIDEDQFRSKYDMETLAEDGVYPVVEADKADADGFFEYIFNYLEQIKIFFKQAIDNKYGIIFYIL
ncbi:MAG: YfbM family protein [Prevotellaceae bacterium]|jgi:hypothetical protein|nr:YfbM family protein [Prevotellaceae bacterium]